MDLSIIFVNYKTAQLLLDCIDSIYTQTKTISLEIIVVDNFSQDDSKETVTGKYPTVVWIDMSYNSGFARANNAGIKIAKGEFVLLLNTDTIILDGALDKAVALFKAEKDAIACGVQLLNTDGSHQISGAHFIKGGLNFLIPLPYLGNFIRYLGYRLKTTVPSVTNVSDKIEVDWLVGAFILTRTKTAQCIPLDEDFFMYAEEIEWCNRLKKEGKIYLFETPRIIHFLGGSSNTYYKTKEKQNNSNLWNKKGQQILVSYILRIRKQYGINWYLLILFFYIIEIPIFFLCILFEKILKGKKSTYQWDNAIGYSKNIIALLNLFFKMLRNQPYFYKIK